MMCESRAFIVLVYVTLIATVFAYNSNKIHNYYNKGLTYNIHKKIQAGSSSWKSFNGIDHTVYKQQSSIRMSSDASVPSSSPDASPATPINYSTKSVARKTIKKLLPLGLMLFCILFNYTILRDTKDVLVITAPNSGAEIIPFLKTYVNLPSAIGFTIMYSKLCNMMPPDKVFYVVMTSFISFFGAFAGFICK